MGLLSPPPPPPPRNKSVKPSIEKIATLRQE